MEWGSLDHIDGLHLVVLHPDDAVAIPNCWVGWVRSSPALHYPMLRSGQHARSARSLRCAQGKPFGLRPQDDNSLAPTPPPSQRGGEDKLLSLFRERVDEQILTQPLFAGLEKTMACCTQMCCAWRALPFGYTTLLHIDTLSARSVQVSAFRPYGMIQNAGYKKESGWCRSPFKPVFLLRLIVVEVVIAY